VTSTDGDRGISQGISIQVHPGAQTFFYKQQALQLSSSTSHFRDPIRERAIQRQRSSQQQRDTEERLPTSNTELVAPIRYHAAHELSSGSSCGFLHGQRVRHLR
jgi:hypothetical protein